VDRPTTSFSHRRAGQEDPAHLEAQQALLVELLRRAGGAAVSYSELRDRGIELPASVVSELELAGFPIDRCYMEDGSRGLGVRLDPTLDPLRPFPEPAAEPPTVAVAALPSRPIHSPRLIALAGLAAVAIAAIVVALATLGSGGGAHRIAVHRPRPRPSHVRATGTRALSAPSRPTPVSATLAYELEAQGHDLLAAGHYSSAVPTLRRAVAATGERLSDCLAPASENCLTYAYALYDLGRALRLSGDPAAAVPVLQQRLQIDNQRPVVMAELMLARSGVQ
jgi:hypothetical protein